MLINVSSYNNSCGLYSLSLGVALAAKNNMAFAVKHVPDWVLAIKEENVVGGASDIDVLSHRLREELYTTIMHNPIYYNSLKVNAVNYILALFNGNPLKAPNYREYIGLVRVGNEKFKQIAKTMKDTFSGLGMYIEAKVAEIEFDASLLDETKVIMRELGRMQGCGALEEFIKSKFNEVTLENLWLICNYLNEASELAIYDGNVESYEIAKNNIKTWFAKICKLHLDSCESNIVERLVCLGRANNLILRHGYSGLKSAKDLYLSYLLERDWDEIYKNYSLYTRNANDHLTLEELTILAAAWHVNLKFDKQNFRCFFADSPLDVVLVNPTNSHWMLKAEIPYEKQAAAQKPQKSSMDSHNVVDELSTDSSSNFLDTRRQVDCLVAAQNSATKSKIYELEEKIKAVTDPDSMQEARFSLAAKHAELKLRYDSLQLEISRLEEKFNVNNNSQSGNILENLNEVLRTDMLSKFRQLEAKKAAYEKMINGQKADEAILNGMMQEKKLIDQSLEKYNSNYKNLQDYLANEKVNKQKSLDIIRPIQEKIGGHNTVIKGKAQDRVKLQKDLDAAEKKEKDAKRRLERDMGEKGTIEIKVNSSSGPNYSKDVAIVLNGKKISPPNGWRGIGMVFLAADTGAVLQPFKSFDTNVSKGQMTEAAKEIDKFKNKDNVVCVFAAADEATAGGGYRNKQRPEHYTESERYWHGWCGGGEHRYRYHNKVRYIPYYDPNASSAELDHLCTSLASVGSVEFRSLYFRGQWYFVSGKGFDESVKEHKRNLFSPESLKYNVNDISPTQTYRSTLPGQKLESDYRTLEKSLKQATENCRNKIIKLDQEIANVNGEIKDGNAKILAQEKLIAGFDIKIVSLNSALEVCRQRREETLARQVEIDNKIKAINLKQDMSESAEKLSESFGFNCKLAPDGHFKDDMYAKYIATDDNRLFCIGFNAKQIFWGFYSFDPDSSEYTYKKVGVTSNAATTAIELQAMGANIVGEFVILYGFNKGLILGRCLYTNSIVCRKIGLVMNSIDHRTLGSSFCQTIRSVVIGRNLFVMGKSPEGYVCMLYDVDANVWQNIPMASKLINVSVSHYKSQKYVWLNKAGLNEERYFTTISTVLCQGSVYVVERGSRFLHIAWFNLERGEWFGSNANHKTFSDEFNWNKPKYYSTFRVLSLGECIYVVGVGSKGIEISAYNTFTNIWVKHDTIKGAFKAALKNEKYYKTFKALTYKDALFFICRFAEGVKVLHYNPASKQCLSLEDIPYFSDADGWGEERKYLSMDVKIINGNIFIMGHGANGTELVVNTELVTRLSFAAAKQDAEISGEQLSALAAKRKDAIALNNEISSVESKLATHRSPSGMQVSLTTQPPIVTAISNNKFAIVKMLLSLMITKNPDFSKQTFSHGWNLLHFAVAAEGIGDISSLRKIISLLISSGVFANQKNSSHQRPDHMASSQELKKYTLASALCFGIYSKNQEVCASLVSAKADLNYQGMFFNTENQEVSGSALTLAAQHQMKLD
jgi:hypothetical protein